MKREKLRRARLKKGLSQKAAAHLMGVSRNTWSLWELGKEDPYPLNVGELCKFFGVKEPSELDLEPSALETEPVPATTICDPLPALPQAQTSILISRRLARLQSWVVDELKDGTHLRWQLYYTSRNSLTEDGLLSQIARLEQLADDGGEHHQRVCCILAQNYQLAGNLARDRFQYTKSLEYFQKAEQLHEDTQLSDLTATAIARQAVALLRKDPERYLKKSQHVHMFSLGMLRLWLEKETIMNA
jgi:transcriptional regulator with XRE-family HTH domain